MAMEFHPKVNAERRLELEQAREHGRNFVTLMGEGSLLAARQALEKARRCMDGDTYDCCSMCGNKQSKYEVCGSCFFSAHQPEEEK